MLTDRVPGLVLSDELMLEMWERMTFGGVSVEFTRRLDSILKEVWLDAIAEGVNAPR